MKKIGQQIYRVRCEAFLLHKLHKFRAVKKSAFTVENSVGDPDPETDPHVVGPPRSGSFPFLINVLRDCNNDCKIKL